MRKLTFFLGAGASVDALPTVVEMPNRFKIFLDFLERYANKEIPIKVKNLRDFISKGREIEYQLRMNTSFDSYARLLYKNRNNSEMEYRLYEFKFFISMYFQFEQMEEHSINLFNSPSEESTPHLDPRYNAFLSEFYDFANNTLPPNINVITWNIDMQYEIALQGMKKGKIEDAQKNLKIFPSNKIESKNAQIIKLNGTAGTSVLSDHDKRSFIISPYPSIEEMAKGINEKYSIEKIARIVKTAFYFAWEDESPYRNEAIERAKELLLESNIIVIVGYSFQRPNFDIDKILFDSVKMYNKQFYFQVNEEHFNEYKLKLRALNNVIEEQQISYISNLKEFYVPYDFKVL